MASAGGGIRLPARSTRGQRIQKLLEEEDDEDDEEFWGQQAWQEDAVDDDYVSEKETSDEGDSDFSEEEDSEDDEEVEVRKERKRPTLKPPGRKAQKSVRVSAPPSAKEAKPRPAQPAPAPAPQARASPRVAQKLAVFAVPRTVRKSTQKRTAEALKEQEKQEKERVEREKRMRKKPKAEEKLLTQEELLAEAAQTEIENMASLAKMIALEEETKAKAMATKKAYDGPMIKYRSFKEGDTSRVVLEVCNMKVPMHMRPQRAPPHPEKLKCVITGLPAKYCDPLTGMPYANLHAFKQIRQRYTPKSPRAKKR
mmetsp:Transcript_33777/g.87643  ORF Transcript_33777/g.87643 Transcript_33777/m.87643 type:complete len:311 (+) Transcript_33777:258-1190(+)|eukprot:jgi/Tetstr1/437003/TSEL_002742.t1